MEIEWHGNSTISDALDDTFSNFFAHDPVGVLSDSVCQVLDLCLVKLGLLFAVTTNPH